MEHKELQSDTRLQLSERPVRLSIPASVAYDLDKFQTSVANLAELLGCYKCLSGRACIFMLEDLFVVDPETLKVTGMGGGR
jgi:hypothetical protein